MESKVLVIGSINMDLNVYGIPKIPKYGEAIDGDAYKYSPGGKAANQAYALAKMGLPVSLIGQIGDDNNGQIIMNNLNNVGVDTQFVVKDSLHQTGLSIMNLNQTGEYFATTVLGANNHLSSEAVERAISRTEYDLILIQFEIPRKTIIETCRIAKKYDIPVIIDAGPPITIDLTQLESVFIFSPNEAEAEALTGIAMNSEDNYLEASRILFDKVQPKYVLLKLGSHGSYLYDGLKGLLFPARKVIAIDSTAAGDTYIAGVTIKLLQGESIDSAIQFGTDAAAICVTRKGAQESIPSYEETINYEFS